MTRKSYSGAAVQATLNGNIGSTTLSFQVSTVTGWPNTAYGPFIVTIAKGKSTEEELLIDSYDGSGNLTVDASGRGYAGTTAQSHNAGDTIQCTWDAVSAQDATDHIYVTSRDDHSQYLDTTRHDVTTRHTFGAALGTPGTPTNIIGATAGVAGSGPGPAAQDHQHPGLPTVGADGTVLSALAAGGNGTQWVWVPGTILASKTDTTTHSVSINYSTLTALDATHFTVGPVTVPASGKLRLKASLFIDYGNGTINATSATLCYLGWLNHTGGAQVGSSSAVLQAVVGSEGAGAIVSFEQIVSGLTPGASIQLDLAAVAADSGLGHWLAANPASGITYLEIAAA